MPTDAAPPLPSAAGPGAHARAPAGRRAAGFLGPGLMVAVGYMDPGNWATSVAAGSRYGESLLAVVVGASLLAMLFQAAAVRLGLATGQDLAQACRERLPPTLATASWLVCEAAIVACNVAEVLGMAMGLHLLFGLSLFAGACVTVADVMLVLRLRARGRGSVETLVAVLVATIALCFVAQLAWARPSAGALWHGLAGVRGLASDPQRLYLAVGIVGATVMPHNLYLHSALVRARGQPGSRPALRRAITAATRDSTASLGLALFVNAAILVVAATAFAHAGHAVVATLPDAYRLLSPLLGVGVASTVFGLGLLASGLSSSITGTLAGQVVMEGFMRLRLSPRRRALLARLLAIVPAAVATARFGESAADALLVFSQVVLSLQLPFALAPLLVFTTSRRHLGDLAFGRLASAALWSGAGLVTLLNGWLLLGLLLRR